MNLEARVVPCLSSNRRSTLRRPRGETLWFLAVGLVGAASLVLCQRGAAQNVLTTSGAGGVRIGPVESVLADDVGTRCEQVNRTVQRYGRPSGRVYRCISLRRLFAAIREQSVPRFSELPEEQRWMAGLTRICFLELHPEAHDVLLVGRGEAWVQKQSGEVVGAGSGWPVYRMEDFATALRAFYFHSQPSVSCSIDPTEEGLTRLRSLMQQPQRSLAADIWQKQLAEALGSHHVTMNGVDPSSRCARIMLAADVRMKRMALQLDQPPLRSLPSYLQLARPLSGIDLPRWWLELREGVLRQSSDGLQWTIGNRPLVACTDPARGKPTGKIDGTHRARDRAERWGQLLTRNLPELCSHYAEFAELHNVSELCLIAMLLRRDRLLERACCLPPEFANQMEGAVFGNPATLPTLTNAVSRGRVWLVAASGGIDLRSVGICASDSGDTDMTVSTRLPYPDFGTRWWTDVEIPENCQSHWDRRSIELRRRQHGKLDEPDAVQGWYRVLNDRSADVFSPPDPSGVSQRRMASGENASSTEPCIIFVLDHSRSMCRRLGNATLLQHGKREVSQWINGLPETTRFNVLLFGNDVAAWRPQALHATGPAKMAAFRFVDESQSEEGTASYDALEWALLSAPAGGHLVFISDGWPTKGKHVVPQEILAAIQTLNAERRLSIHCVGIACDRAQSEFMQNLAAANKGSFRRFGSRRRYADERRIHRMPRDVVDVNAQRTGCLPATSKSVFARDVAN